MYKIRSFYDFDDAEVVHPEHDTLVLNGWWLTTIAPGTSRPFTRAFTRDAGLD